MKINTVPLGHGEEGHVPANFLVLRTRRSRGTRLKARGGGSGSGRDGRSAIYALEPRKEPRPSSCSLWSPRRLGAGAPRPSNRNRPALLGGVEPLLNDQMKVVDLLLARSGGSPEPGPPQFLVLAGVVDNIPASAATGLVLEAWPTRASATRARRSAAGRRRDLDPKPRQGRPVPFGAAGALLVEGHATASAAERCELD